MDSHETLAAETRRILASMPLEEREALQRRFGIGIPEKATLEQMEQLFQFTRERIRQVEREALDRLRDTDQDGD